MRVLSALLAFFLLLACGKAPDDTLFSSMQKNNLPSARQSIEEGANVNARNRFGATPLHFARSSSMAMLLIDHGADLNAHDRMGMTPLNTATRRSNTHLVRVLLEKGAKPSPESKGSRNALMDVPTAELARMLIDHGADPDGADENGMRPLHMAAGKGRLDVAKLLIGDGAQVNAQDRPWANTPLHYAMILIQPDMARLLVESGADINRRNAMKITPLHYSAKFTTIRVARYLLLNGADPFARNDYGEDPLDLAILSGNSTIIEMLRQSQVLFPKPLGSPLAFDKQLGPQLAQFFATLQARRNRLFDLTVQLPVGK